MFQKFVAQICWKIRRPRCEFISFLVCIDNFDEVSYRTLVYRKKRKYFIWLEILSQRNQVF